MMMDCLPSRGQYLRSVVYKLNAAVESTRWHWPSVIMCLDAILQIATTICIINSDVIWLMIETDHSNSSSKHSECSFSDRLSSWRRLDS